jgi:hypothetical protein
MPHEHEHAHPDLDERIRATLATTIGVLPDEFDALHQYLKTSRNMLKYHYSENSIHFDDETQGALAKLVTKSDYLICEFARLEYACRDWAASAEKSQRTNRAFAVDKKELADFQSDFKRLQDDINALGVRTLELLKQISKNGNLE